MKQWKNLILPHESMAPLTKEILEDSTVFEVQDNWQALKASICIVDEQIFLQRIMVMWLKLLNCCLWICFQWKLLLYPLRIEQIISIRIMCTHFPWITVKDYYQISWSSSLNDFGALVNHGWKSVSYNIGRRHVTTWTQNMWLHANSQRRGDLQSWDSSSKIA